jgi:hypothetical protein
MQMSSDLQYISRQALPDSIFQDRKFFEGRSAIAKQ